MPILTMIIQPVLGPISLLIQLTVTFAQSVLENRENEAPVLTLQSRFNCVTQFCGKSENNKCEANNNNL